MQTDAVLSYSRIMAIEEFQQVMEKAQAGFLFRRLLSKDGGLESFRSVMPSLEPARQYRGTVEIPVGRIVGSVDRGADFDASFRPLAPHLRDRWISVYLLAGESGWPPIRAFKVGDRYYVEDGHNRVSVARRFGMQTIRAEVWEYSFKRQTAAKIIRARGAIATFRWRSADPSRPAARDSPEGGRMVALGDTLPWFGRHSRVFLAGIQDFPEWMPAKYTRA